MLGFFMELRDNAKLTTDNTTHNHITVIHEGLTVTTITMWLHVRTCIISPYHLLSCEYPLFSPDVCCHGDWHDTNHATVEQH